MITELKNGNMASSSQLIVQELIDLLSARSDLKAALLESIRTADLPNLISLEQYFKFLNEMVTLIPTERNLNSHLNTFYYLIGCSPDQILQKDDVFQRWACEFAKTWGAFLDTPASAAGIAGFLKSPDFHLSDYAPAPSGWLTFNQFFARQVRPGKRPVASLRDDNIVVSPADSVYQGQWPIDKKAKITVKGLTWSILDLLDGSPYQSRFEGGIFTHSFLDVNDYHRFHVPVAGRVKEARKIPGHVIMDVVKESDGSLNCIDGTGYQFSQDRGLLVLDSPLGLVAVLPIGMAQVSSVNFTAEVGADLEKGEEFGFFAFGGSDMVILFEAGRVQLDAKIGVHYKQGMRIGHV